MKWNELPLMWVLDESDKTWIGPYHVLELRSGYHQTFCPQDGSVGRSFTHTKPYNAPTRRPMTRDEVLAWACSADALGWVVRHSDGYPYCPQRVHYDSSTNDYTRSRASATGDYKWEPFEVEDDACGRKGGANE